MRPLLDRIRDLIALTESPNENEARNAAIAAVRLIRKHRIVLSVPSGSKEKAVPAARKRSSARGVRTVTNPAERIVAPLGGDCLHCGARYRAGQTVFWFRAGGGMHVTCYDESRAAR
jgi:hypothetical protein